ncbi:MAG TPA: choice-of-anchor D domain-containing protein, partial [Kofleriaceae bacterium]|nr:choice-of-anchor D domain-containing protein [Kofleriaceae bacterium]
MSKRWLGLLLLVVWIGGSGVAHAALTASPDPVPIGTVTIGQSGSTTTTLSASPSVTINSFDLSASGCTEFTLQPSTPPLPRTVGIGSNALTITVTLTPTSTGAKSCLITALDASNAVLGTFTATGTGTAPQISVAPLSLTFSNTEVGRTSTAKTVTATNTGNTSLTISSATFQSGAGDYIIVTGQTGSQTVTPGNSVSWDIACKPSAQGARPGTFRIASNSLNTPTNTDVTLSCTGEQGIITTIPTSLDFGPVAAGTTKPLTFTLKNTGNVPITGITGTLDKTTIGYQFNAATVPTMLAAGASTTLTVTFAPQSSTDGGPATIIFHANWGSSGSTTMATLTLNGDGLATGYDVSSMAIDFMNFRFDARPTQVFSIINSGGSNVTILTQTFTPDTGTASSEFGFIIKKTGVVVTLPQTLAPGQQLDVTVTAQPNNRIGLVSGHVDIHTDLAIMPDRRVTLTGNATTAGIAFPAMVDFGPVDVDGAAPSQTIMLTNNGMAILDVSSITKMAGASPSFSVTLPSGATQVSPGTILALQVTYTPTVEQPPNQPDTMVLVANLAGIVGGPNQAMITVKGHGADRHLLVDSVEDFPPTFRNPGDMAPIKSITVRNNGEATLRIAGVMVTGAPVWELLDGSAIDLPGGGSHDFLVKFSPTMVGAAPTGQLTIVNNDNAKPMAVVTLTGAGIGRNVAFGPPTINLGYVVIGGRTTTADLLAVTNLDPSVTFTIHAIQLDDDSVFHIEKAPADDVLPAVTAQNFGITFEPTTEGHFETTARLYLDQDDQEQAKVMITGDASGSLAVHGGGGCSTGGGAGGGAAIALAAFVFRRRRRALAAAAISLAMLGGARSAFADDVVVGVFDPTPTTSGTGFQLDTPEVGPAGSWVASGVVSYATDLLVFDTLNGGVQVSADHAIKQRTMFSLGGAYAFLDRFEAGLRLPVYSQHGDAPRASQPAPATYVTPATGTALGDLTIHGKARLARAGAATFGAAVHVTLPTATAGQFTGVNGPSARVLGLAAWAPSARLSLSASAGGVLRKTSVYRDTASISQGSGFVWGTSASVRVLDRLWATGEVFGEIVRSGRTELGMNTLALAPVEALAGATYRIRGVSFGAAVGRGITDGIGAPDLRGVMMLSYTTGSPELAPLHPYVPPAPDLDSDGDGIVDKLDRCPHEPEDKDGFQDDDGCPDLDNDGDGIADANDKCPNEPEDKDGFQDEDGCPDPDNDGDGIADAKDKCPDEPETFNGKDDDDGCPDTVDAASVAAASTKAAEETFTQGRELLKQGKYAEACTAFEQSQRLDPQFGTQYNIAGCYEKTGKLATAWNLYRALARSDTNPTRRSKSAALAASLGRRVPK